MVERDIRERYFRLLKGDVVSQDEKYLLEASGLGREMLLAGVPEENVAEMHEEATGRLAQEFPEMTLQDAATSVSIPLMEVLMVYSLAFRTEIEERKRAGEALKESEEKFRELTELLPQIVYEINLEGNFTYTNKIAPKLIGYTSEEIEAGLNFEQIFSKEDYERAQKNMQKIIFERELGISEYTLIKKNGDLMPILVYSTVLLPFIKRINHVD